jgi:Putative beta-barrel porin-2, OmpL-like. bbp2
MIKYISVLKIIFLILIFFNISNAQNGSGLISGLPDGLSINGYIDSYISWDNDKQTSLRQFSSISPYRDEFRLNIAQISVNYEADRVKGIATIHFGDIPSVNWPTNQ